jgi:predicted phosphodiesterase
MKIRLMSDLHIDYNHKYKITLPQDDVFTLIAGDISGIPTKTIDWINDNVKNGAFCAGNHIVYNPRVFDRAFPEAQTIETIKNKLHEAFPLDGNVTFLDYDVGVMCKQLDDKTLLIGDVMYTDYKLKVKYVNPNGSVKVNMSLAEPGNRYKTYLNDFVYGFTDNKKLSRHKDSTHSLWSLSSKYYKYHHNNAWKELTRIVEENSDKNIIIMTHHCLSTGCISASYCNDSLNASYVSNKDNWIKKHPNVKLILSGHVHHRTNFKVGETQYVLNPLGYCRYHMLQMNHETGKSEMWTPYCYIDTDTWELTYEPYDNAEWRDIRDKEDSFSLFF